MKGKPSSTASKAAQNKGEKEDAPGIDQTVSISNKTFYDIEPVAMQSYEYTATVCVCVLLGSGCREVLLVGRPGAQYHHGGQVGFQS